MKTILFAFLLFLNYNSIAQQISISINKEKSRFDSNSVSIYTTVSNLTDKTIFFNPSPLFNVIIEPNAIDYKENKSLVLGEILYINCNPQKGFVSIKKGQNVSFEIFKSGYSFKKDKEYKLYIDYKSNIERKNAFLGNVSTTPIYFKVNFE
ncbi:MAG: hypothetical protein JXL97_05780 [Bacteroidales bacterium]|nr:hypothetical protein [Bacteroidales bacterium]